MPRFFIKNFIKSSKPTGFTAF
jgi:hypothetical protein